MSTAAAPPPAITTTTTMSTMTSGKPEPPLVPGGVLPIEVCPPDAVGLADADAEPSGVSPGVCPGAVASAAVGVDVELPAGADVAVPPGVWPGGVGPEAVGVGPLECDGVGVGRAVGVGVGLAVGVGVGVDPLIMISPCIAAQPWREQ